MTFLKAEWKKLAIANYEVDRSLLKKYLPKGTELDSWNNTHFISLVGFMFKNTRVLGFKIPFHINFEEVNLRFYVKRKFGNEWKRGVVFIKEIVPKYAITLVANSLYNENYVTHKMKHQWSIHQNKLMVSYSWKIKGSWQKFEVFADKNLSKIIPNSDVEFITEHYWGYTKVNNFKTSEYEVTHPKWDHYKVKQSNINVDFGLTYGREFMFLNDVKPKSVMLAEGSNITVKSKSVIKVT